MDHLVVVCQCFWQDILLKLISGIVNFRWYFISTMNVVWFPWNFIHRKKTHLIWQVNFMHHISSPISYIDGIHSMKIHRITTTFIQWLSVTSIHYIKKIMTMFLEKQFIYNVVYYKLLVLMHTHTIWPSVVIRMMTTIVCLCMYVCFSNFALSCHGFLSIWSSICGITSHVQCNSNMSHVIYTHYLSTSEGVYAGICFFNFEMYPNWRSSIRRLIWL